jgi:serine-type D-Ala-D-Ala carboxypeptidase/endopeptidase (penicillin-binding protein 4)
VLIIGLQRCSFKGFVCESPKILPVVRLLIALLSAFFSSAAWTDSLPTPVLQALRAARIPVESVAVVVQEVGASRASVSVNARRPMNPASTMKLVTTFAALELLGPAYRWKTEIYVDGPHTGEVLQGNLVVRGQGDPKLTYESFWLLLRGLRGRGLREIRGDVLLDRTYFAPVANGLIDEEAFRPYNVPPDALLVNFKSLRFTFVPQTASPEVLIFAQPALPGLQIVNGLRMRAGGRCPDGRAFRDVIQASFEPSPHPKAVFSGRYPVECGERELHVALFAPEDYVEAMFRQLWAEMGGIWQGRVRNADTPPDARLAYVHESVPLADVVRDVNKFSNNVMARQLYLTLAAELGGPPARTENALHALRQWLESKRIKAPELVIENGSGLSRVERISAANLAALLQAAWQSAVMPEFIASLPIVAVDGTMRRRLLGERVAGQAHVKTGLLVDARTMAGYVLDRRGRRQIVVMLVNHPNAPKAQEALDAMLRWAHAAGALDAGQAPDQAPR